MLCATCSNIHFKTLQDIGIPEDLIPGKYRHFPDNPRTFVFYFHHVNEATLRISAGKGCHFCAMLWGQLFSTDTRNPEMNPIDDFAGAGIYLRRQWIPSWVETKGPDAWNIGELISACCEDRQALLRMIAKYSEPFQSMLTALTSCNDHITANDHDALDLKINISSIDQEEQDFFQNSRLYSHVLDTTTIAAGNILLAKLWINDCLQHHKPCSSGAKNSLLPHRVIDINDPRRPFLSVARAEPSQYVTLSYKWGESRRYVTNDQNYDTHLTEIPVKELPWTFKEAIEATYSLGFRYLWIDALCIIQGNTKDLEQALSSMDMIYHQSTLTLFAAAGNDADAGLSVSRDPRWVKPCRLNLRSTVGSNTIEGLVFVNFGYKHVYEPLFDRGWVLQEQILSRRALIFGPQQVAWFCLCGSSSEYGPEHVTYQATTDLGSAQHGEWQIDSTKLNNSSQLGLWLQYKSPMLDRPPQPRNNQFDQWYKMVEAYSSRSLTHSSDVLAALSGLANAMSQTHGCSYNSGLWEEDLQIGLAWYVDFRRSTNNLQTEKYIPSWSWASQWGKHVHFRTWKRSATHIVHLGVRLLDTQSFVATNKIGNSSRLTLSGRLRTAMVCTRRSLHRFVDDDVSYGNDVGGRWVAGVLSLKTGFEIGEIALDHDPKVVPVNEIVCLLCTVREKYGEWNLTCLALKRSKAAEEVYHRVGLVFLRSRRGFGKLSTEQLPLGDSESCGTDTLRKTVIVI